MLGGTFDPPHLGHLLLANSAAAQFELDRVLFVPAGDPYHRRPGSGFPAVSERAETSPSPDRLAMTRLAVAGNERFAVDGREVQRSGRTFTVDTLEELAPELARSEGAGELFVLLGSDSVAEIGRWRSPQRIAELATVLVAPRADGHPVPEWVRARTVDMPRVDITSTSIRARLIAGRPVRYLVTDTVEAYIREHGLYTAAE